MSRSNSETMRSGPRSQFELRRPRNVGAMIGEIDDLPLLRPVDCAVRRIDKALQRLGMPVIASRLPLVAVHALLHHRPFAVGRHEEAVQVKVETVLDRGAVDLGHQAAGARQLCAVEADAVGELQQLVRRLARVLTSAATDINSELVLKRSEPALQCADHGGGDAGRVPVHSHHCAERLEPERMRQPLEERIAAVMMHDRLGDDRSQRRHATCQPRRNPAGVKREIGAAGSSSHAVQSSAIRRRLHQRDAALH